MSNTPINLLGLDRFALQKFFVDIDEKPFRAQQILKWLHVIGISDFQDMTDLSKSLRTKLSLLTTFDVPQIIFEKKASCGTHKWLLRLADGNCIETVFIPEKSRGTLCISSQVGCALNCDFCSTGKQGFNRNLSTAEIISQVWIAARKLSKANGSLDHTITNVVFMGMGEPLLNLEQVIPALNLLLDDFAYGLSKRRVTVSTSGIVPAMQRLRDASDVALAVSLHAPNDELRDQLVPINKKYPLANLMSACRTYFMNEPRRSITMEYVMLADVNDSLFHAKQLVKLLQGIRVKMNLIPFNPFPNTQYHSSCLPVIHQFRDHLLKAGLNTTIRKTRGDDIDAACGQLVGEVKLRQARLVKKTLSSYHWTK